MIPISSQKPFFLLVTPKFPPLPVTVEPNRRVGQHSQHQPDRRLLVAVDPEQAGLFNLAATAQHLLLLTPTPQTCTGTVAAAGRRRRVGSGSSPTP